MTETEGSSVREVDDVMQLALKGAGGAFKRGNIVSSSEIRKGRKDSLLESPEENSFPDTLMLAP